MKVTTAVARALQETFDPEHETEFASWEKISRRVIAALRNDTNFDVMPSAYCESCPVRQRIELAMKQGRQRND